jgi:diguanylate cyclase (GGDEF)-like protein/PAS domain S-box-containing protein
MSGMTTISVQITPPLILVVDDDKTMRILLRKAMENEGYQVVEAKNGEECLAVYERLQPDIILMDAIMPVMDGFACCTQLQKLSGSNPPAALSSGSVGKQSERVPVLMITVLDDEASINRAFEVGAIDYVTKPIQWAVLRQRVRRLLQQSQLYKALHRSEQRFRSLVQNASDVITIHATTGITHYVSESVQRILGYRCEDLVGSNILSLVHPDDTVQMKNFFAECLVKSGVTPLVELRFRHGNGYWCYLEAIGNNLLDEPSVGGIVLNFRDISERKCAAERLRHNAFHDPLTDLPNRTLFMDRLEQAVQHAKRHKDYVFAVLFLDLDRFKIINDSLGHMSGDQLLIGIARRLERCLRAGDTIARLGGDEFAILLNSIEDVNYATSIAERIKQELALPFNVNGHEVFTSASIGIVLGNEAYSWLDDLLRTADIAMYHAKARGKSRYEVFDTAMNDQAFMRLQLETDLRQAIVRQEFRVDYQPIVLLKTGIVIGFEALLRWEHPLRGLISPEEFIPVAEETGLIMPIGQWVLHEACRQMRAWQVEFPTCPLLTISVNFSIKQFTQPELIEQIAGILQEINLDARHLRLELTESMLMENAECVTAVLLQLKALGVWLYLDDFGTGYSSLSYLHRFPINALKIDRSFVNRMGYSDESCEIVRAITTLAHALGMDVIAEGVETIEQLAQLSTLECKYGQGNFFSKPLDSATATALIAENFGVWTTALF